MDLTRVAALLDVAVVSAADAVAMLQDASSIVKLASTVQGLLARRVSETEAWREAGARSPAEFLAKSSGQSTAAAKETIESAKRMKEQPSVEEAARRGELSAQQQAAISDAAKADPSSAGRLVEMAKRSSLGELKDECARVKAAAEPDPEARHEEIRRGRFARKYPCPDGAAEIRFRSTAEDVAEVWTAVQSWTERIFRAAQKEGRSESSEAYAADAMLAMARAAAGGTDAASDPRPVPAKVIIRVDWDTLVRGWPLDGETCEIPGVGQVPVSVVNAMIDSSAFLAVVLTKGVDVVNVAHVRRTFTAAQVTGMEWKDPTCAVLGCNCTWRLEKDHRADWAETKVTMLAFADRLCDHHHDLKTRQGWALVDGVGKRPMVPPEDPQHPKHQRRPPRPDTGGSEPQPGTIEYDLMRMAERLTAEQAAAP